MFVTEFLDAWFALYGKFLKDRTDSETWGKTLASIRQWIAHGNGMEVYPKVFTTNKEQQV